MDLSSGTLAIPVAVWSASLLGSGHCAAMCGGLVMAITPSRSAQVRYHLGRLAAYAGLGAAAGGLGSRAMGSLQSPAWSLGAAVFLALGLVAIGVQTWKGRPVHFPLMPSAMWQRLMRWGMQWPTWAGFWSAFLPCGWLHSFVLAAVATQSATVGAIELAFFWLGTLPALTVAPGIVRRIVGPTLRQSPRLAGLLLIAAGLGSVGWKIAPWAWGSAESSHCHHHSSAP